MSDQTIQEKKATKIMTPKEAVEKLVKDGDIVAAGGFTVTRKSYAIFYVKINVTNPKKEARSTSQMDLAF